MDNKQIAEILVRMADTMLFAKGERLATLPALSTEEWNDILTFASQQGVLPIVMTLIASHKIADNATRKLMLRWYVSVIKNRQLCQLQLKTMRQIARLMASEGIDIMFMKGAALARLYPNPEWRVFSDIDFYLYGMSEQGIDLMSRHGITNRDFPHHHTQAMLNGVLLENHYDFVERVNHRCNIPVDNALKTLADKEGKSVPATFLGDKIHNAYVMTPTMNAIFLMRHMSAHFVAETTPLRQLYDWALFLRQYSREVDWPLVTSVYEQSGMTRFAGIIQQVLRSYLDFECADCPIVFGNAEDARRVWTGIIHPPKPDPHRKYSMKYYLYEAKVFLSNRWKHGIVYPGESYAGLFFRFAWHKAAFWFKRKVMKKS